MVDTTTLITSRTVELTFVYKITHTLRNTTNIDMGNRGTAIINYCILKIKTNTQDLKLHVTR